MLACMGRYLAKLAGLAGLPLLVACAAHPIKPSASGPGIELSDCHNLGGNFAVPFDRAQAALPDGFTPLPTRGGPQAGAVFYIIAVQCRQSSVDGRALGPAGMAYAELPVKPPPGQTVAGMSDYSVPVMFTAQPAELARVFAAHGLGHGASGRIEWAGSDPSHGLTVRVTAGDVAFAMDGASWDASGGVSGFGIFALYGVHDGQVTSKIVGSSSRAHVQRGRLHLALKAGSGLFAHASVQARGFALSGFDLAFWVASNRPAPVAH